MDNFRVGNAEICRIHEMDSPSGAVPTYFSDFDQDAFERHRHWLVPTHVQPGDLRVKMSFHSWLVRVEGKNFLVDTCCGNHKVRPSKPRFHMLDTPFLSRLADVGLTVADIDYVLCTHLHVDHVGWNTRLIDGRWVPTFPNAKYVMSRKELAFWEATSKKADVHPSDKNTYDDSVLPVVEAGMAVLVDDGEDISHELRIVPSPGHTPGHMNIELSSNGARAVFTGDMIHSPLQLPFWRWNSTFCEDFEQATATRKAVLDQCVEHHQLLIPSHFMAPHVCRIVRAGEGFMPQWGA